MSWSARGKVSIGLEENAGHVMQDPITPLLDTELSHIASVRVHSCGVANAPPRRGGGGGGEEVRGVRAFLHQRVDELVGQGADGDIRPLGDVEDVMGEPIATISAAWLVHDALCEGPQPAQYPEQG